MANEKTVNANLEVVTPEVVEAPLANAELIAPHSKEFIDKRDAEWLELSAAERARQDYIRNMSSVSKKSLEIVSFALDGAKIDDDGPAPKGWNSHHERVARDARKTAKQRPSYLDIAVKNLELTRKLEEHSDAPPSLNASIINVYVDQRIYPVKPIKE
jgi:hypothetical protein